MQPLHMSGDGIRALSLSAQQECPSIFLAAKSSSGCRTAHQYTAFLRLKVWPMFHCRFELILELDAAVRLDMAGRALALEFEQASQYYRVEVHLLLDESLC